MRLPSRLYRAGLIIYAIQILENVRHVLSFVVARGCINVYKKSNNNFPFNNFKKGVPLTRGFL